MALAKYMSGNIPLSVSWREATNSLQLSGIALGYGLDDLEFESLHGLGTFLFTTASRTALGPTQPPIQRVPKGSFPGGKAVVA
jgi:hypothetical protein